MSWARLGQWLNGLVGFVVSVQSVTQSTSKFHSPPRPQRVAPHFTSERHGGFIGRLGKVRVFNLYSEVWLKALRTTEVGSEHPESSKVNNSNTCTVEWVWRFPFLWDSFVMPRRLSDKSHCWHLVTVESYHSSTCLMTSVQIVGKCNFYTSMTVITPGVVYFLLREVPIIW